MASSSSPPPFYGVTTPLDSRRKQTSRHDMSVLVHRVNLCDTDRLSSIARKQADKAADYNDQPPPMVAPYVFECSNDGDNPVHATVQVCRVPCRQAPVLLPSVLVVATTTTMTTPSTASTSDEAVVGLSGDDETDNDGGGGRLVVGSPGTNGQQQQQQPDCPALGKYWRQRHSLFARFDQGIQLDDQGWYSVTPEPIAMHVATQMTQLCRAYHADSNGATGSGGIVVLDAFTGCGGNAIAFARQDHIDQVVCCDIDRSKLRKACHNAAIYNIPPHKLIFLEVNVLFILEFVYHDGVYVLDQPLTDVSRLQALMAAMPPPVPCEVVQGYTVGGLDLLPRHLTSVFVDPPWGGVDYNSLGMGGYDLAQHMKIQKSTGPSAATRPPAVSTAGAGLDGFFDTFQPQTKQERQAMFNITLDDNCINGAELLRLAARATAHHLVVFDVPRNVSHSTLGQYAVAAGYRGNCKLEEYCWNRKVKTVSVYFGTCWQHLVAMDDGPTMAAAAAMDYDDDYDDDDAFNAQY